MGAAAMITLALVADVIGALLGLIGASILIVIPFWIIMYLWFTLLGISLMNARRLGTAITGSVIEMIPVLNILPGFTVAIIAIIIMIKSEDKLGITLPTSPK